MFSQHSFLILFFSRAVKLKTFSIFRSLYVDKRNPFSHSYLRLDRGAGAFIVNRGEDWDATFDETSGRQGGRWKKLWTRVRKPGAKTSFCHSLHLWPWQSQLLSGPHFSCLKGEGWIRTRSSRTQETPRAVGHPDECIRLYKVMRSGR